MKRPFKKKETPKVTLKDYSGLVNTIDQHINELEENNLDIETILNILKGRELNDSEKEQIKSAMKSALDLSSSIQKALEK